jgi:hypothetical protein
MIALNGVDWSNAASIENFSNKLESLGINMDDMGDKVENLENDL